MTTGQLTPRMLDIVVLEANGATHVEVTKRLFIAYSTVTATIAGAKERTGTKSTSHLVAHCIRTGAIRWDDKKQEWVAA